MMEAVCGFAAGVRVALRASTRGSLWIVAPHLARSCSTIPCIYDGRDPAPLFFNPKVQEILKRVTSRDLNTIFRRRFDEKRLDPPDLKFLTEDELSMHWELTGKKAKDQLQMPPIVKQREPIQEVLSRDPALIGFTNCAYVFTDISYGLSDRKRFIVVRDADGTLRQASWEERDRMNAIYNPKPARKQLSYRVFEEENLKNVLDREEYKFLLDLACAQYEPDHPDYQRVTGRVYEAVDARRCYQKLHSTRHYGPLCFYLVWNRKIDNMIIKFIQDEHLSQGADLVSLYHLIHPDSKSASHNVDPKQPLETIKAYMEHDSLQRAKLQLAIQSYLDLVQNRQEHKENIQTAHGL